jgi:hypothetical protein
MKGFHQATWRDRTLTHKKAEKGTPNHGKSAKDSGVPSTVYVRWAPEDLSDLGKEFGRHIGLLYETVVGV